MEGLNPKKRELQLDVPFLQTRATHAWMQNGHLFFWASVALVCLYDNLNDASVFTTKALGRVCHTFTGNISFSVLYLLFIYGHFFYSIKVFNLIFFVVWTYF
jgi:hypothetical protein